MRSFSFARRCSLTVTLLFVFSMCSCASVSKQGVAGACSKNLGSAIKNFCVVTPNVLWRGGRPDKDGAAWLIQQGVRTIVNIELILDDKSAFGNPTVENANNYEVGYFRVHDWEPLRIFAPSVVDDHVAHFLAIVSQQPKPVYVHCRYGIHVPWIRTIGGPQLLGIASLHQRGQLSLGNGRREHTALHQ